MWTLVIWTTTIWTTTTSCLTGTFLTTFHSTPVRKRQHSKSDFGASDWAVLMWGRFFKIGLLASVAHPADGDGTSRMAEWRRRQLCWGTQDVHSDDRSVTVFIFFFPRPQRVG